MAVRSGSDSLYSASANLDYVESQLAKLMFIVGLDWSDINTTTIDDIINKVRRRWSLPAILVRLIFLLRSMIGCRVRMLS